MGYQSTYKRHIRSRQQPQYPRPLAMLLVILSCSLLFLSSTSTITTVSCLSALPRTHSSSTPLSTTTTTAAAAPTPFPFRKFSFASNNVCINPNSFYCTREVEKNTAKNKSNDSDNDDDDDDNDNDSTSNTQELHTEIGTETEIMEFKMKNVPGDGDCMFLAVALATSASMGLGGNNALLNAIAKETRTVVAQVLSTPDGHLHVNGNRIVRVRDLLKSATMNEHKHNPNVNSMEEYIDALLDGSLQGGGPELTVLSNILRRPISVYELDEEQPSLIDTSTDARDTNEIDGGIGNDEERGEQQQQQDIKNGIPSKYKIKCVGSFGDIFKDPCSDIPNPAVLSGLLPGAYSWHIHILVVDAGPGEKHACALLPKRCYI